MAGKKVIDLGVDVTNSRDVSGYIGRELLRSVAQPNLLQYRPHPKQERFHRSEKKIKLYIGGNRSGKSVGGVIEDLYWLRKNHPYKRLPIAPSEPTRGRVCAVDFVQGIDKIILPLFAQWTPKSMLLHGSWTQSYDKSHRTLTFTNGSFVEFLSYDQDLDKFAGTSRHFVHEDEEPPKDVHDENMARLIDTNGHLWMTMTPVEGMTWVYDAIYEPGVLGHRLYDVVVVDMTENPYLSQQAITDFLDTLDENDIEARVHGKFIQMGGLIYKLFDPIPGGKHVIPGRWFPPKSERGLWKFAMGLDHGFNNPTAVSLVAYNSDGQLIVFDEYYKNHCTISENAAAILKMLAKYGIHPSQLDPMVADPNIKAVDPITGTSIQQEYAKRGLSFQLGINDVKTGIVQVTSYLKPVRPGAKPRLMFTENCDNHIREHARYKWKTYEVKEKNSEYNVFEEPHKLNDHTCDEIRYLLMSRPDIFKPMHAKTDPDMLMGTFAPRASDGVIIAGHEEDDIIEWERNHFSRELSTGFGQDEFDEHMGGIW